MVFSSSKDTLIDTILFRIPSESDWTHTYIVTTLPQIRNRVDGPIFGVQPDPVIVQTMDLKCSGIAVRGLHPIGAASLIT